MSSFTAPLVLETLASEYESRGEFRLYLPFSYDVGFLGSGDTVTVPAGFKTDLASIPWFARAFIPISGRVAKPALLHDWLLGQGDSRAHEVFDEALSVEAVSPLLRWLMVQSGGFMRAFPSRSAVRSTVIS
jgi:hypothetical protein